MTSVIYYPGFEVEDEDWLKFALFCLPSVSLIVPPLGAGLLSPQFHTVQERVELFEVKGPSLEQGRRATQGAIDKISSVLRTPQAFFDVFRRPDPGAPWRVRKSWTYELFHEKYSDGWLPFCRESGLGEESVNGLLVHPQVGHLYMSFLAQHIGDATDKSLVTDRSDLDRLSLLVHRTDDPSGRHLRATRLTLRLQLPAPLREISLKTALEIRARDDYGPALEAFHGTLAQRLARAERSRSADGLATSTQRAWAVLRQHWAQGTQVASTALGLWLYFESGGTGADTTRELLGATAAAAPGVLAVRNSWSGMQRRKLTRRYLATLRGIPMGVPDAD